MSPAESDLQLIFPAHSPDFLHCIDTYRDGFFSQNLCDSFPVTRESPSYVVHSGAGHIQTRDRISEYHRLAAMIAIAASSGGCVITQSHHSQLRTFGFASRVDVSTPQDYVSSAKHYDGTDGLVSWILLISRPVEVEGYPYCVEA